MLEMIAKIYLLRTERIGRIKHISMSPLGGCAVERWLGSKPARACEQAPERTEVRK
jgi:hypothetical protein